MSGNKQEQKRKRDEGRDSLEAVNPFAKNKKIGHSPKKEDNMGREEMEEMKEMKGMLKRIIGDIEVLMEDRKKSREEMDALRQEWNKREERWNAERKEWREEREEWKARMYDMERKVEEKEKRERKNNIVISGIKWEEVDTEKKVEGWIKKELAVDVMVEEAYRIGQRNMVVVKLKKWEEKKKIMMNKSRLKGIKKEVVYINDDWTKKERDIQKKIRYIARVKLGEGRKVRVGYKKMELDGKWFKWDEMAEKMDWNVNF